MKKHFYFFILILTIPLLMSEKGYVGTQYIAPSKAVAQAGIIFNGNNMYIADNDEIVAYDVTQPDKPKESGRSYINGGVDTLYTYQQLLIAGRDGIYSNVYDISTPNQLVSSGLKWEWSSCSKVTIYGNQVFAMDKAGYKCTGDNPVNGIRMYRLNDANAAEYITTFSYHDVLAMAATEKTLYVSVDSVGLTIVDTDAKRERKTLAGNIYNEIKITGNRMYCRGTRSLDCFDITIPQTPILLSRLPN